jgi:RHS repeat-associated protein
LTTNAGSTTTYFIGNYYEITGSEITKYYYAGSQRVAMRKNGTLNFIIGDHLGSTSLVTDANGVVISETKYKAWGEVRYSSGAEQTKYTYTGQYSYVSDFGLHFYNARWYDSSLSRFTSPDSIIPDPYNSQDWDKYIYTLNNPIRFNDPSGHCSGDPNNNKNPDIDCWNKISEITSKYKNLKLDASRWTLEELVTLEKSLNDIEALVGLEEAGNINIRRRHIDLTYIIKWIFGDKPLGIYDPIFDTITLYDGTFTNSDVADITIYHEFAHDVQHENPEEFLEYINKFWAGCPINTECATEGIPSSNTPIEDFAETFAISLALEVNQGDIKPFADHISSFPDSDRLNYMDSYIDILQSRK